MAVIPPDEPIRSTFTRALRFVDHHREPLLLAYHPVARVNPYQALLYGKAHEAGVAPVGVVDVADIEALEAPLTAGATTALHLHWTSEITGRSHDQPEARLNAERFLWRLEGLQDRGLRLIWTVHNSLPHRCPFPEVETWFRSRLAEAADMIHVMHPRTCDAVADLYPLPLERVVTVPHPSYEGAYPTHHSRETVRLEMGFERSNLILGLIGSIQPYKGFDSFRHALRAAASVEPRMRGLVAGMPGRDPDSAELVLDLVSDDLITCVPRRLTDGDMARVVSALDVAVLPYQASLNSGSALLAATFGVPVVGPALGSFLELAEAGLCLCYDPGDPDGLTKALLDAPDWVTTFDHDAAKRFSQERSGPEISRAFFAEVRGRLGRPALQ